MEMSLDWMPIETAPEDTRVLVYSTSDGILVGIYSPFNKGWYSAESYGGFIGIDPTDWQPLPPPPFPKKKVDKQT
jgi:hypothetical protein